MTDELGKGKRMAVGFVGIGNMGWPMAARLVEAGFALRAADGRRAQVDAFVQQAGGTAADSLRALAETSDLVVTMLPTSAAVGAVLDEVLPSSQKNFRQLVLSRRFDSGFGLDLMVKDLGIALGVARDTGTAAPFAGLCRELSVAAQALLGPGADHTEFARLSERLAGSALTPVESPDAPASGA